jgi:hypothetical protein
MRMDGALMRSPLRFTYEPDGFVAELSGLAIVLGWEVALIGGTALGEALEVGSLLV